MINQKPNPMSKRRKAYEIQVEIDAVNSSPLAGLTDRQILSAEAAQAKHGAEMESKVSGTSRIRSPGKRKTKLTMDQAEEIRKRYIPYVIGKKRLGDEFGVSVMTVLKIIRNQIFKSEKNNQK